MQEEQDRLKAQILEAQQALEGMRQVLAEENRKLDSRKNEYDLLKSLVDSMEGYPESVKFLHKNSSWGKQAPLLSDIIYVKEEYRAAVENVLEPFLNYYVVECLQDGIKAIQLLDQNKKGKANFFVMDRLKKSDIKNQPSNTIKALEVVEVDEIYMPLASHLLGNVFIALDETALEDESDAVILEKSGKMVKGKYALSGGSVGLFEGKKIGRAKNLEKMFADIQEQESVVKAKKDEIQQKHDLVLDYNSQLKEQAIRQLSQKINDLSNQVFVLQNKADNLSTQNKNAESRISDLNQNMTTQQEAIATTRQELTGLNENLFKLQDEIQKNENDYNEAEKAYNEASNAYNNANLMLTRQQSKISSLQQEFDFKTNQLQSLLNQMDESKVQLQNSESTIADTAVLLAGLETAVLELLKAKEEAEKILNIKDQEYYNTRTILNQKESELRLKQRSKEGIDILLNEIKDRLTELKLQLAGMKERLHVEFRIDLDAIIDEPRTGDAPLDELQEKSERMKKRLENIGEVNPTAIEAFTEMRKRYEFILEQKNDLVTAKDSLMQTIQEVEATANQQFLDTFNRTRENFQKVFKALFTEEDTADMILVDPENLAETGIDIVAKPKGKRPSSIGQLSGGEKTLTATALLFAIYLIKPAPFCILDEVDAPLDDANVGKFTSMIKQFSENSQFIIVTHNKMTMSAVDVIYGVTMQEAGVSKLVPVDFRSLN
jgi:chromosome segregation protein